MGRQDKDKEIAEISEAIKGQAIYRMFQNQVEKYGDETFISHKIDGRRNNVSWNEVNQKIIWIAAGLISLGLKKGDRVAIFSRNRVEWLYGDMAVFSIGCTVACIYETDSPLQCKHILHTSDATMIIVEDQERLDKVLEIWGECNTLKKIIVLEKYRLERSQHVQDVIGFDDLYELGRKSYPEIKKEINEQIDKVKPEDLALIVYTSGTTGLPKGAMLSHRNVLASCESMHRSFPEIDHRAFGINPLPMAHVGELVLGQTFRMYVGCPYGFCETMDTFIKDCVEIEPTYIFSAGRIFEKVYGEFGNIAGNTDSSSQEILDFVKQKFGKKINLLIIGGASKELYEFYGRALPALNLYGLTEASSAVIVETVKEYKHGSCGKPMPGVKARIADDGELQIYCLSICSGYVKDPAASRELFTDDGWLCTGDLASIDDEGFIYVTDRKKNVFRTAGGKNVTPLMLENLLKTSPFISQAVVYGDNKPYLVCLLTLDEEQILQFARGNRVIYDDFRSLTKHPKIVSLIWDEIQEKNRAVSRPEQIKKFFILEEALRQDYEEVTPTMRAKRKNIEKKFGDILSRLYRLDRSEPTFGFKEED